MNNFECTVSSLKAFQHALMRTDSVSYAKLGRDPLRVEERTPGKGRCKKCELTPVRDVWERDILLQTARIRIVNAEPETKKDI